MKRGPLFLGAVVGVAAAAWARARGPRPHVDVYLASGELRRIAGSEPAVRTLIGEAETVLGPNAH
jgi:hypothetical protein